MPKTQRTQSRPSQDTLHNPTPLNKPKKKPNPLSDSSQHTQQYFPKKKPNPQSEASTTLTMRSTTEPSSSDVVILTISL